MLSCLSYPRTTSSQPVLFPAALICSLSYPQPVLSQAYIALPIWSPSCLVLRLSDLQPDLSQSDLSLVWLISSLSPDCLISSLSYHQPALSPDCLISSLAYPSQSYSLTVWSPACLIPASPIPRLSDLQPVLSPDCVISPACPAQRLPYSSASLHPQFSCISHQMLSM
jgi:hypothetical protein